MIKEKLVIEAYRKAFGFSDIAIITLDDVASSIKFLEEYQQLDIMDNFQQTEINFVPYQWPVNSAKQIALEASVKLTTAYFELRGRYGAGSKEEPSETVKLADEIYQWLIKKDINHDSD